MLLSLEVEPDCLPTPFLHLSSSPSPEESTQLTSSHFPAWRPLEENNHTEWSFVSQFGAGFDEVHTVSRRKTRSSVLLLFCHTSHTSSPKWSPKQKKWTVWDAVAEHVLRKRDISIKYSKFVYLKMCANLVYHSITYLLQYYLFK